MFSEWLNIKPRIDPATGKKMERDLLKRFDKVSKTFGKGLKTILTGGIIGAAVGMLMQFLAPLDAVEERIRGLLERGQDINDFAARMGATGGEVQKLQDFAGARGVSADRLRELMQSYAKAIETGQAEIEKGGELSLSTQALKNYVGEENQARGFFNFIQQLKNQSPEERARIEKEVFGDRQFGSARRFLDSDFGDLSRRLGTPSVDQYTKALNNLEARNEQAGFLRTQNEGRNLIRDSRALNPNVIQTMEASAQRERQREMKELENYQRLAKAQEAIEIVRDTLIVLKNIVTEGIILLKDLVMWVKKVAKRFGLGG